MGDDAIIPNRRGALACPSVDIKKDPSILKTIHRYLWRLDQAVAYPPNQVFIGSLVPNGHRLIKNPIICIL